MKLSEAVKGKSVKYIPHHAKGNIYHEDVEVGVISSANDQYVFVKFEPQLSRFGFDGTTAQACRPEDLVLD